MTRTNYYLKRTIGIYCITHIETGKQYCGQSVDCFERFKQHSTPKKNSTGIKGAIMKWGVDAFSFVILEECKREELNEREVWWIAELGTLSPGGYNLTSGGGQGTVVSEETRARQSVSAKGNTYALNKGKPQSPEVIAARVESLRLAKAALTEPASYTALLQSVLNSLRHDSTWIPMADEAKPPADPPSVVPPTLEELEALLQLL